MSRYQRLFDTLSARGEGAFVPFVTLGDPNPGDSLAVIEALIAGGADALELGFPFSDPAADGPTIQDANIRALNAGTTPGHCFEILAQIRQRHPDLPIGLLVYANLVFSPGLDTFYRRCAEVGVDSVLVADVPVQEATPFIEAAKAHGVAPIFIAPPNADDATLQAVAEAGQGYTYLLSRAGVTGTETAAGMPVDHLLEALKRFGAPPAVLGFGIAEPSQVKSAIDAGAAGAISGSAVVKLIAQHQHDRAALTQALTDFVQGMKAATR
ncbi:tryptophan synthase, alpha chain [Ferrimonas balearica DSM 9799]|uniref:Tryptophan synthase alpha chain n=1 Tax=Ferrimonas balearica (strain DSM 9799 / CCM 4581 / KCTC 23876 / PAT) TaxID=550540 RepID=E1SPC6_FERBD|nr:tryptophan synthase subunit alpha [Ferrimonas balearica]ADN76743.1 tryptophan synthase, alpha chain [Ferrimonas balearica DSM 9799]MBW3140270.1 tryptophan synthase subunit alpha [Ferrimonas balearica]